MKPIHFLQAKWIASTLLVFVASGICARLGIWQMDRLAQRRAFNAAVTDALAGPELDLPADEAPQEYQRVRVRGTYDYDHQLALRNQAQGGEYGFHLVTPLMLVSDNREATPVAVLIDRGWIPADDNANPENWRRYDVPPPVDIEGVVRMGQPSIVTLSNDFSESPESDPAPRFVRFIEPQTVAAELPYELLPYYVQADASPGSVQLPVAQPTLPDLSEGPHLSYAIQWFGFSVAILVGYGLHVRKQEAGMHG